MEKELQLNLLIPMAGVGQRFKDAGYKEPKPFVDVNGTPMIKRVLDNLQAFREGYRVIFVGRDERIAEYFPQAEFVKIDQLTQGAACTCLLAKHLIDDDELIIANSDQLVLDYGWVRAGIQHFKRKRCAAGVWCFLNQKNNHSYATVDENQYIRAIVEKVVVSDLALTGVHWFEKGSTFVQAAEYMVKKNIRTNGEFYLSPVFNLLKEGKGVYMVNQFLSMGTPEELEESLPYVT